MDPDGGGRCQEAIFQDFDGRPVARDIDLIDAPRRILLQQEAISADQTKSVGPFERLGGRTVGNRAHLAVLADRDPPQLVRGDRIGIQGTVAAEYNAVDSLEPFVPGEQLELL